MKKPYRSAKVSLAITWLFMAVLVALLFAMPSLIQWYCRLRALRRDDGAVILIAFYLCAPAAGVSLLCVQKILSRVCAGEVFCLGNAKLMYCVSWCCCAVAAVTAVACPHYPPLAFVFVLMLFLFLIVRVVADAFRAATVLREEQDLTI